jgi:hypothetical protein
MLSGTETRLDGGKATVSGAAQRLQLQRGLFSSSSRNRGSLAWGQMAHQRGTSCWHSYTRGQWSQHFSTGLHGQRKRSLKVLWT